MPRTCGSDPSSGIQLRRLLVCPGTVLAEFNGYASLALVAYHQSDATVAVPVVVPVDDSGDVRQLFSLQASAFRRKSGRCSIDRNRDSENGLSFETLGRWNDLSTPSSSRWLSSVAAFIALPLSACRIRGRFRSLLTSSLRQGLLTRSFVLPVPSR
jgi:hypothetical protein